jgi:hypothetical protein
MERWIDRGRARVSKYVWLAKSGIVSILCVWIAQARGKVMLYYVLVENGYDESNMITKRCFPTLVHSRLCESDVNERQIY